MVSIPLGHKQKRTGRQAASLNRFCQCSTDKKADAIKRKNREKTRRAPDLTCKFIH